MTFSPRPRGSSAEQLVTNHFVQQGWQILERRFRISHYEIDLLVQHNEVVALVEVRGRRTSGWISALDSIDQRKRTSLQKAAKLLWSTRFECDPTVQTLRIDIAAVTWGPPFGQTIEIIEGAIEVFI